ncbi:MAG TPA: TIGR00725 family protein [Dehalococcoidia bacterium]|nr:TIGR00725 family protein [Dehalococcoidia bacterium]
MEPVIAVIGGGQCTAGEARLAEAVGKELGRRGITLVCGGLGGVMEAACRGAIQAGGRTIGILPGSRREDANPYIQVAIATGMGYARNVMVVMSSQAVIAIGGSYGTLSEIAHALQNGIPVIGLGTWSASRDEERAEVIPARDAVDAVDKALALMRSGQGR